MHPNEQLIEQFYQGFQKQDASKMIACYADNIEFSDPVFPNLKGKEAKAMWQMLCERAKNFELTYSHIQANETSGKAHWEAKYLYGKKQVHNIIEAEFRFHQGKIVWHQDSFDLWRWSRMALGPMGTLLGWTSLLKNKIRRMAGHGLQQYIAKKG
ncbi:MAG: nuclear transport factor 2 family protein [Planctomycetota bacterium]